MSLIRCPECGREISDKASSCPGCGYPLSMQKYSSTDEYKAQGEKNQTYHNCEANTTSDAGKRAGGVKYINPETDSISIAAFILSLATLCSLSFLGVFGFVFAIFCFILSIKAVVEKHALFGLGIAGIVISWFAFFVNFSILYNELWNRLATWYR